MIIYNLLVAVERFIQYGDLPTSYYRLRGMTIGKNLNRQSHTKFDPSHCWLINIGDDVTISNGVIFLAHDDSTRNYLGYGKIGKIFIGDNTFVGANAIILPNVIIGANSIIGAGSVVTKDIPERSVAVGTPAKIIMSLDDYLEKMRHTLENGAPVFDISYTIYGKGLNKQKKAEMNDRLRHHIGFQKLWKHHE